MKTIFKLIIVLCILGANMLKAQEQWCPLLNNPFLGNYTALGSKGTAFVIDTVKNELYIGGHFKMAGGFVNHNGITKWDGTGFSALGNGIDNIKANEIYVNALAIYNGDVYAGGHFFSAEGKGANCIAKWNGMNWSGLDSGITHSNLSFPLIRAMAVYNGELFVAGEFDSVNFMPAKYIAKWNGTTWTSVGAGTNGQISALAVYKGELYAGGNFSNAGGVSVTNIAKWGGNNWSACGLGISSGVSHLYSFNGDLYASTGGTSSKWDGATWTALPLSGMLSIKDITSHNGELYATGTNTKTSNLARWNGAGWDTLTGSGFGIINNNEYETAMISYKGDLYATGRLFSFGNNSIKEGLAKWTNENCFPATGIERKSSKKMGVTIYPNPMTDLSELIIQHEGDKESGLRIELYDMVGREVSTSEIINNTCKINNRNLMNGIYYYRVRANDNLISSGKLVIQ